MRRLINKETVTYLIFGVLTTVLNYTVLGVWRFLFGNEEEITLWGNTAAFIIATSFAYITNKIFVFQSKNWTGKTLLKEAVSFFGARLFSFALVEQLGIHLAYVLNLDKWTLLGIDGIFMAKIVLSVIGVVLNYIMSKLFVFNKKKDRRDSDEAKGFADHTGLQ